MPSPLPPAFEKNYVERWAYLISLQHSVTDGEEGFHEICNLTAFTVSIKDERFLFHFQNVTFVYAPSGIAQRTDKLISTVLTGNIANGDVHLPTFDLLPSKQRCLHNGKVGSLLCIEDGVDDEGGTWMQSIVRVVVDLVAHDISNSNRIFALCAWGDIEGKDIFDALRTIKLAETIRKHQRQRWQNLCNGPAGSSTVEEVLKFLEQNGARTTRKWASKETIATAFSEKDAQFMLAWLKPDASFRRAFIHEYLPEPCHNWNSGALGECGVRRACISS